MSVGPILTREQREQLVRGASIGLCPDLGLKNRRGTIESADVAPRLVLVRFGNMPCNGSSGLVCVLSEIDGERDPRERANKIEVGGC